LGLAFFGLTLDNASKIRINLFNTIHEIVFHGNGGYDWETVYNMPTWLRTFTFNKLKKYYDEQAEATKKASKGNSTQIDLNQPTKNAPPQTIQPPSYVTKRAKK
tara:strand:+ start:1967 stop:2278 length:312 start_codon:yes stop_codon:yes gene_type:complete